MSAVGYILFFLLGFLQFFATFMGVQVLLGSVHWLLIGFIAGVLAWVPIIGSIAAVLGAHYAWGWSWLGAILLFFGPLIAAGALFFGSLALDKARAR